MGAVKYRVDMILVDRLWKLYAWPIIFLPFGRATVNEVMQSNPVDEYVDDDIRAFNCDSVGVEWHHGRVRFFYEELLKGRSLDPITIDNVCSGMFVYPEPTVLDGHHRLVAYRLAKFSRVPAYYGGRVDLLKFLDGRRKTAPRS